MAIGSTSTIKDANGVSVTVKDVAADYLVEQANGAFNRENFRTDASQVIVDSGTITNFLTTEMFGVGLTGDIVVSSNDYKIIWNDTHTNMKKTTKYATHTNGSSINILKTGYYMCSLVLGVTDMTGNNNMWGLIKATGASGTYDLCGNQSPKMFNECAVNTCVVASLQAGDVLEALASRDMSTGFRISANKTYFTLVPVYIP